MHINIDNYQRAQFPLPYGQFSWNSSDVEILQELNSEYPQHPPAIVEVTLSMTPPTSFIQLSNFNLNATHQLIQITYAVIINHALYPATTVLNSTHHYEDIVIPSGSNYTIYMFNATLCIVNQVPISQCQKSAYVMGSLAVPFVGADQYVGCLPDLYEGVWYVECMNKTWIYQYSLQQYTNSTNSWIPLGEQGNIYWQYGVEYLTDPVAILIQFAPNSYVLNNPNMTYISIPYFDNRFVSIQHANDSVLSPTQFFDIPPSDSKPVHLNIPGLCISAYISECVH